MAIEALLETYCTQQPEVTPCPDFDTLIAAGGGKNRQRGMIGNGIYRKQVRRKVFHQPKTAHAEYMELRIAPPGE